MKYDDDDKIDYDDIDNGISNIINHYRLPLSSITIDYTIINNYSIISFYHCEFSKISIQSGAIALNKIAHQN